MLFNAPIPTLGESKVVGKDFPGLSVTSLDKDHNS